MIVSLSFIGCDKPQNVFSELKELDNSSTPVATPSASPSPAAETPKTPITPVSQETAPQTNTTENECLYLTKRISVPTDGGVRGFRTGTKVEVVSSNANTLMVSAEGIQFEVSASDVTNNPEYAKTVVTPAQPVVTQKKTETQISKPLAQKELESKTAKRAEERAKIQARLQQIPRDIDNIQSRSIFLQQEIKRYRRADSSPQGRARLAELQKLGMEITNLTNESITLKHQLQQMDFMDIVVSKQP